MPDKTKEELKQLALDIRQGLVFTDMHCPQSEDINRVFMVLMLMDKKQREEFCDDIKSGKIGMIYQYLEKAMPRSLNGMPQFMSLQSISAGEKEIVMGYIQKLEEAEKKVLDEK